MILNPNADRMAEIATDILLEDQQPKNSVTNQDSGEDGCGVLDLHVVILINYVRKHHVVSYQELAKRVRKLTILLSTPMEPGRDWDPEWCNLDVRVQKNWMLTTNWKHSAGFQEKNFIHVPVDTVKQLRQLKPDIVFSYEMGMRTMFSGWFRMFHRNVPLVMVGNMSQNIEQERGLLRRTFRAMVRRLADHFTYNGPSCKRYLQSLGIADEKMFHVPYCVDDDVVYTGPRVLAPKDRARRLFYSGSICERKGLLQFMDSLIRWCKANPSKQIDFQFAGAGPLEEQLSTMAMENLKMTFFGNLDPAGLAAANEQADICIMPTFADEWALTPIEGLASGIPVIGSFYAQSVEAVVKEGVNGWIFTPDDTPAMDNAIDKALACDADALFAMAADCRKSVAHISGAETAERFCDVVRAVLPTTKTVTQK